MKTLFALAGATLALSATQAAVAAPVEIHVAGVVTTLGFPLPGTSPDGVIVGDAVTMRVRFDTSSLFDVTDQANFYFGPGLYTNLQAARLSVPGTFLDVTVGPNHFTQDAQAPLFPNFLFPTGGPYVLFNNGHFFGVDFSAIGDHLASFATAGAAPQLFDFVGGNYLDGGPSYGGFLDYANATSHGVPEPGVWSLLIMGFGLTGAALRRRRAITA